MAAKFVIGGPGKT